MIFIFSSILYSEENGIMKYFREKLTKEIFQTLFVIALSGVLSYCYLKLLFFYRGKKIPFCFLSVVFSMKYFYVGKVMLRRHMFFLYNFNVF